MIRKKIKLVAKVFLRPQEGAGVPTGVRLKAALRGFTQNECRWYNFPHNDMGEYISELDRIKARDINGSFKECLDDKFLFEEVFADHIRVPRNYLRVKDGDIQPLHGASVPDDEALVSFVAQHLPVVFKKNKAGGGRETYVIKLAEGATVDAPRFVTNGKTLTPQELVSLIRCDGEGLLCEYITQGAFPASLYPGSTNTIRMCCAKKKGESKAKLILAVQRIGSDDSAPVDNLCSGGFASTVDLETGQLGPARARSCREERMLVPFDVHPDSGAQVAGRVIPDWNQLKQKLEEVTNAFPAINFVAWDVLLTDEGPCVIEGNASTGCTMFQMEHGVRDGVLGDVYRSYGII